MMAESLPGSLPGHHTCKLWCSSSFPWVQHLSVHLEGMVPRQCGSVQSLWEQLAHMGADGKCSHLPLLGAQTTILGARGLSWCSQSHGDKVENTDIKNYWGKKSGLRLWNIFWKFEMLCWLSCHQNSEVGCSQRNVRNLTAWENHWHFMHYA